jgi:hypothetical protein
MAVPRTVRISFSVLLRVSDDDRYVLFASPARPGTCGPPGGVIKYFPPAARILEKLGFLQERGGARPGIMKWDLRGQLPEASVRPFMRWYRTGAYREDARECLHREMAEELEEVNLAHLDSGLAKLGFTPVRTVVEGPAVVPGKPYRQLRRFEVYDLQTSGGPALRLSAKLFEIGEDPLFPDVICATRADISHGRLGQVLIAPQSAFLFGTTRLTPDVPPIL